MKLIAFSLWGDNKVYTYGMVENIILAKSLYPDWIVRVHYNDTVPINIIEWMTTQNNTELIHHPGGEKTAMNTFWRFEDIFIPDAITIVRDADSRLNEREVKIVNNWLSSDKDFYSCRDHKHHTVPIMAGAFGCRNNCLKFIPLKNDNKNMNGPRYTYRDGLDLMKQFININSNGKYNIDQMFLGTYVYPNICLNCNFYTSHNNYEPFCKILNPVETGYMGEVIEDCPVAASIFLDNTTVFKRTGQYE